jgi:hypothetical protein
MKGYRIRTAYGMTYILDERGRVLRHYGNGKDYNKTGMDLDTWIVTGFWKHSHFGRVQYLPLEAAGNITDWKLKDGTPRYGLTDIDHGTHRLQGNKQYHGVACVEIVA